MGSTLVFYILSIAAIASALGVVVFSSPIYSALCLALTMTSLAALFFTLEAYFLAGVQLMVYAGAVVVMFVMVLMMFDLRRESKAFSGNLIINAVKILISAVILGLVLVPAAKVFQGFRHVQENQVITKNLSQTLFFQNVLGFEMVGVLLLVVLVGALALAKSKGGTHE